MANPYEFCNDELWRVTTVQIFKIAKKKQDNLGKRENKCTKRKRCLPKICLPKTSICDKQ